MTAADTGQATPWSPRLSAEDIRRLDPYGFLAVLGKRVIHPGGRHSTQELLELADLAAGQQVLDIGCGVATTAIQVAQRFHAQVTAADLAPLMLARAHANVTAAGLDGQVSVEQADILALPLSRRRLRPGHRRGRHHVRRPTPGCRRAGAGVPARRAGAGHRVLLAATPVRRGPPGVPR